ncbi:MAG TPA: transporter substrate-binding domain-containing protein, partial [Salinivirgaceae bacterium]|nr:transporter substrate-binding domain-containing protein [Salinivirgaceae bacterium]
MRRNFRFLSLAIMLFLLALLFSRIDFSTILKSKKPKVKFRTLSEIIDSDTLRVLHDHNAINYFSYRGHVMGFHYDMATELAKHLGVKMKVMLCNNFDEAFELVNKGEVDLVAMNLSVTPERSQRVSFTIPYSVSRQVLVQRKPANWQQLTRNELMQRMIRFPGDLARKEIYVQAGTIHEQRLINLCKEIGDTIYVKIIPGYSTEQLISMVANGTIDFTVSDEDVAMLNETFYENLDIQTPLSVRYDLAWAVAKGNSTLLDTVNLWLETFIRSANFKVLYQKYFLSPKATVRLSNEMVSVIGGKISPFDDIIKEEAQTLGWDWRLLASLIYQESRFNPSVVSWTGAFGLMQLMPETGRAFGVSENSSPKEQIRAGVRFLKYLDKFFYDYVPDSLERIKFVLAAYNVGHGHVLDAIRLSEKYQKNPKVWRHNVDSCLLKKADPAYFLDPVVRHGYCRGEEPYLFVNEIFDRYHQYKNLL